MSSGKKYTHLFFDMDNTLTRSRSKITRAMKELLASRPEDILVISGAAREQIAFQLDDLPVFIMAQNGNHVVQNEVELWRRDLSHEELAEIEAHIASLPRDWEVPDEEDLVERRGSQVSYSIYGHHAPVEDKERFDPDQKKRTALLAAAPLESETLTVKIAGTTSLDYIRKDGTKGDNIARLIDELGWDKSECVYFGDSLFPGGNDESVVGVIETIEVTDPDDTYTKLTELGSTD